MKQSESGFAAALSPEKIKSSRLQALTGTQGDQCAFSGHFLTAAASMTLVMWIKSLRRI
jgi:hypothetical protein